MLRFWSTVALPILLGTLAIVAANLLKRKILKNNPISPLQYLVILNSLCLIGLAAAYVLIWGFTMPPKLQPRFWTAVALGATADFVIHFLNARAASIDKGEVSLTAPLQAMTPFLITVLAVTLGEFPGRVGCAGVACMIAGSYVLLWEKTPEHWYDYIGPVRRLRQLLYLGRLSPEERNKTIVVCLSLGSAAMGTLGLLFGGLYTRRGGDLQGLFLALIGVTGIMCTAYAVWHIVAGRATPEQRRNFRSLFRGNTLSWLMLITAAIWVAHFLLIQPVFTKTFVAYVGTLKRFSILLSVVLGFVLFKEAELKKRLWAAILIVVGAVLISLDDLPSRVSSGIETLGF